MVNMVVTVMLASSICKSIFRRLLIKYVEMLVTISFGYPDWAGNLSIVAIKTIVSKEKILVLPYTVIRAGMEVMPNRTVVKEMAPLQEGDMNLSNVVGTSK